MTQPPVYVARKIPENGLALLQSQCNVTVHQEQLPPSRDELLAKVKGCHGILSLLSERIDGEVFDAAGDQLRVVSNFAVGFNNIDLAEAKGRGISVGNTPDVLTDATADVAVGLLLSVARNFPQSARDVRQGQWKTWEPLGWVGLDLVSKTVGIVGMGRIGEAVAKRLHHGWGMTVLYTSREPKPKVERELGARRLSLNELLQQSDFVSLHVPLTAETTHLIGESQLRLMRQDAILINTARGEIVDQQALVDTLQAGQLFGAGLDVCTPEPLPSDSALLQLPNCQVLPHIGSATQVARNAMSERAAQNILAGVRGETLPFPVR